MSGTAPTITSQPASTSVPANTDATFAIAATGTAVLLFQWYVSPSSGGNAWNPIPGATADTLTIDNVPQTDAQNKYRCQVRNSFGQATSSAAFLTVTTPTDGSPYIIQDPDDAAGMIGDTVNFLVEAGGDPTLDYQWRVSTDGGSTFTDLTDGGEYSGTDTDTLTVDGLSLPDQGNLFNCEVSNSVGNVVCNAAALTIGDPIITEQPEAANGQVGDSVDFFVGAEGATALSYQWKISTDGGSTFTDLSDGGEYSGTDTSDLTVGPIASDDDGDLFLCVVSDTAGTIDSDPAGLTVNLAPNPIFVTIPAENRIVNASQVDSANSGAIVPSFTGGYPPYVVQAGEVNNTGEFGQAFYVDEGGGDYSIDYFWSNSLQTPIIIGFGSWIGFVAPIFIDSEGQTTTVGQVTNGLNLGMMIMPAPGAANFLGQIDAPVMTGAGSTAADSNILTYTESGLGTDFTGAMIAGSLGGLPTDFTPTGTDTQNVQGHETTSPGTPISITFLGAISFDNSAQFYLSPIGTAVYTLSG